jgi:hypothetical protein
MCKIYHLEINGLHSYYTTLTGLCNDNNIGISKFTLDRHNFDTPYVKVNIIIRKSFLRSGAKQEVKKEIIKTSAKIETKQTNIKVNILPGTYIKKGEEYFFNLDDEIMTLDEIKILGYKTPKNSIGNISDLL